jgi:hypothetical protein
VAFALCLQSPDLLVELVHCILVLVPDLHRGLLVLPGQLLVLLFQGVVLGLELSVFLLELELDLLEHLELLIMLPHHGRYQLELLTCACVRLGLLRDS